MITCLLYLLVIYSTVVVIKDAHFGDSFSWHKFHLKSALKISIYLFVDLDTE